MITAANGEAALEQACQHRPQVILMDMRMPVMDGWTAVKKLKDLPETGRFPSSASVPTATGRSCLGVGGGLRRRRTEADRLSTGSCC